MHTYNTHVRKFGIGNVGLVLFLILGWVCVYFGSWQVLHLLPSVLVNDELKLAFVDSGVSKWMCEWCEYECEVQLSG